MKARMNNRLLNGFFLMLMSPALTLVHTLRRKQSKVYLKWMLIFFSTLYASTFQIEGIGDGTRHWGRVYQYYMDLPFAQFIADLKDILLFRTNLNVTGDVYIHFLSYFVGNVLGAPGIFFTFVGFIYGYFFASSMVKVFDVFPSPRKHFGFFVLAIYFIAILNLKSMNTVRTWTGFWILFYATIQYYDTRKVKYLFLLFVPPLVHIGYFIMAVPVWAAIFIPMRRLWIVAIYSFSFIGVFFSPQDAVKQLQQSEVGQAKVSGYYVEEQSTMDERIAHYGDGPWYLRYQKSGILNWVVVALTLMFILNGDYLLKMNQRESLLFSAGMLTKAVSNNTWFLFALGNRSGVISVLFILAGLLLYWQRRYLSRNPLQLKLFLKPVFTVCIALILPIFAFHTSTIIQFTSAFMAGFPFLAWAGINITLRELIGNLLGTG